MYKIVVQHVVNMLGAKIKKIMAQALKNPTSRNRFEVNKGKWDRIASTFWWKIYLENGKIFTGYSKGLNVREKANKNHLFITFVNRIWSKSYVQKSYKMEIFKNDPIFEEHELVCVLTKDNFDLQPYFFGNKEIEEFLKKTYQGIKTGQMPDLTVKVPKGQPIKLDYTIQFKNDEDLRAYCIKKINDGFTKGEVQNYFYKMLEKVESRQKFHQQQNENLAQEKQFRRTPKVTTNSEGHIQPEAPPKVEKTWIEEYRDKKFAELKKLYYKFNYINIDAKQKQTINTSFENATNKAELDDYFENFSKLIINKQF